MEANLPFFVPLFPLWFDSLLRYLCDLLFKRLPVRLPSALRVFVFFVVKLPSLAVSNLLQHLPNVSIRPKDPRHRVISIRFILERNLVRELDSQ
jgi:hypothetical protein